MLIIEEVAHIIDDKVQDIYYDAENSGGGNLFLNEMPADPDECVMLEWLGGEQMLPSSLHVSLFETRFRGNADDRLSCYVLAEETRERLHGWTRSRNPDHDGQIILIEVAGPPASIGYDEHRRPECILQFNVSHDTLRA